MQGLRGRIIALQTLWMVGSESDPWFSVNYAEVAALPTSAQIRQICYILRATPVAPPSDPGDFTQDRLDQATKLYLSLDKRTLASERRAREIGLSKFTQIGRCFDLGGHDPTLQKLGIAPLEGPGGSTGERVINGKVHRLARETIGGCLPLNMLGPENTIWGDASLPINPAPTGDLVLSPLIGEWCGHIITGLRAVRPSLGWDFETVNTAAYGRQMQAALFTTEDEVGKQFIMNPTQGGTEFTGEGYDRIFWQGPPRPIEKKIYTDEHGSTVHEVLTIPVEFQPFSVPADWPYDTTRITPAIEEGVVAAWTGLRFRCRHTFHYRGIPGVIRADTFIENDFDLAPAGVAPGTGAFDPVLSVSWHGPRDIVNINTEGYCFDAASQVRTALHGLGPVFWPVNPPPATGRDWTLTNKTFVSDDAPTGSMASPVPSGRGGIYGRSTGGAHADLCMAVYQNFESGRHGAYASSLAMQQIIVVPDNPEPPRDASETFHLSGHFKGHPVNGFRAGALNTGLGIRAGVSQYTTFFLLGTQAEVEANMRTLYLLGY